MAKRGRPSKPWSVIDRGRRYWYYKLRFWQDYESTEIPIKRNAKGQATNRSDADHYASEQYQRAILYNKRGLTLREFLDPYFVWDRCPHVKQLVADGNVPTERYIAEQRRRLELLVFTHPIAEIEVEKLTPGHFEDWKADLRSQGYSGLRGDDEKEAFEAWRGGERDGAGKLHIPPEERAHLPRNEIGSRTINAALSAVKKAFANGVHRRSIDVNPASSVGKVVERTRSRGIFSPAELRKMFVEQASSWGYGENYHGNKDAKRKGSAQGPLSHAEAWSFGFVIATTGERPSAVLLCRWEHLQDDVLTFPDVKDPRKDGRQVPLIPAVVEAINQVPRRGPFIWGYESGESFGYTWFTKRFQHMMKTLGLPERMDGMKRTPYSLKDTLVTELIDRDVSEILVRELVGHSQTYGERALSASQARYKRRRIARLREVLPVIEELIA
ncbi:hypothetical protein SAMN05920897_1239 [Alkalispirochaeta americana]|uniref:Phage integrase family protein n=1 Tax=Alkalispirochaeta americana TaxID=159291 RepID=A0A1N6XDZ7_9SPIO|nr:hypothetical protein [Alkalispirochaeta americana]SIR00487.1 hypothetical protein SAMN05920897_1239 [Alkalispirochaeta americana]